MVAKRPLALHSYANLDEIKFEHLNWTVEIDFAAQQLKGTAEYTFAHTAKADAAEDASPVLVLDTHHLVVEKAFVAGKEVPFELLPSDDVFGSALVIPIEADTKKVKVQYATTAESSGLQWLPKELTADKTHPFLFTQCQAIHARSIVPSPDTPSAKFTYTAHVTVPEWSTVLLSAIADKKKPKATTDGKRVVTFHQEVPIPSYLLAVAAGRMESAEIGPRSRVWAEPSVVAKAAHEFSQTEEFLKHAEEITAQEYVWKRYDLVCLPPSFPYGGMENPCLTFVTPTLLAGDRSLADVVAHEISHSWTGNLVTNYSWRDFWLNEGWTMWLERKIQTRIYNDPLAYDLKATMGLRDLIESVEDFGHEHPYTHLVPDVDGVDPDEVFSSIPYEKGFNFLHYLMTVVGGHDVFDAFAKAYIKHFRFKTLTSEDFRDFFVNYFTHVVEGKSEAIAQIDWQLWYHTPGMPPVASKFDTTRTSQAIGLAEEMLASADSETWTTVSSHGLKKWPATLWILLLDTLLLNQSEKTLVLSPEHVDAIDAFCHKHLSTTHNAELRFRWFTLLLRSKDLRLLEKTTGFLHEQGRMKYVRPLFRDLCKAVGPSEAAKIFATSKALYHPIAAKMIQRDIDDAHKALTATKAATETVTVTKSEPGKKITTTTTTTTKTVSAGGVVHVTKDVKTDVKEVKKADAVKTADNEVKKVVIADKKVKKVVIADKKANHRLARFLGIPHEYASYSPLAALAISAAIVATVVTISKRR
ncbi:Leukotriene a-4 hydrolase/aminopeptidase [Globisporangium polare]